MDDPTLIIEATTDTPAVYIHVNPLYALYHYLIREGQRPREERDPVLAEAARAAAQARHLLGVHGVWDVWEQRVAQGGTADEVVAGLMEAMTETVTQLGSALRAAEAGFNQRLWPERWATVQAALATIQDFVQPCFAAMTQRQAFAPCLDRVACHHLRGERPPYPRLHRPGPHRLRRGSRSVPVVQGSRSPGAVGRVDGGSE